MRYSFAVESTLGKLARLLRLVGFDTRLHTGRPDPQALDDLAHPGRLILTRTLRVYAELTPERAILLSADSSVDQLRELFVRLAIQRSELKPLTRCTLCNDALIEVSRHELADLVPDYVRQQHQIFRLCPVCRRVYWPGSHVARIKTRLNEWFQ